MKINLLVRIKNKAFWVALIPMVLILIELIASLFGFTLDLGELGNKILRIVEVVFAILATFGVVNDPTTYGINDSKRAMTYKEPYKDEEDKE